LLLFGGPIHWRAKKARGERRRIRSDWIAVERDGGSLLDGNELRAKGLAFNLLDRQAARISARTPIAH
jgi:peptide chain release factor 3